MRNIVPFAAILGLIGLALLLVTATSTSERFDHSAIGSKGLELWLKKNDVEVIRSSLKRAPDPSDISVRILTIRELDFAYSSERQPNVDVVETKLYQIPTLVVFPKWHENIIRNRVAAKTMLISQADVEAAIGAIAEFSTIALRRDSPGFVEKELTVDGAVHKVALYRPQLIDRKTLPDYCSELAGFPDGALIISCNVGYQFYALSDPDLFNNHGLAVAGNADFAVSITRTLREAGDQRPIYLDTHANWQGNAEADGEGEHYTRSSSDLGRLFDYPLSAIWASSLLVTAIVFWRGNRRFGPPLREEASGVDHSKTSTIEAMTRLLRLSGNDGRMTAQFVHDLLADKAAQIFGLRDAASIERLFSWLGRRNSAHGERLRSVSTLLMEQGPTMRQADLHRNLHFFSELLGSTDLGSG